MNHWGNHQQPPLGRKLPSSKRLGGSRIDRGRNHEIFFTSGGTEANNLAIHGTLKGSPHPSSEVVTSTIEHPATRALETLEKMEMSCTGFQSTDSIHSI